VIVQCVQSILHTPPPIGSVITVQHFGSYNNGRLKHAVFWRVRNDISWEDVSSIRDSRKTIGNAIWTKKENQRTFFSLLGKELGYTQMEDWYNLKKEDVEKYGGKALLNKFYDNSPLKALQLVYPEHTWCAWKFDDKLPVGFWESKGNQRYIENLVQLSL
jgi:hypothetical protein